MTDVSCTCSADTERKPRQRAATRGLTAATISHPCVFFGHARTKFRVRPNTANPKLSPNLIAYELERISLRLGVGLTDRR